VSISGASVTLPATANVSELSLHGGAMLKLAANGGVTLRTNGLFLDADTTLDLADNDLIVDYTGDSPAAFVRRLLMSGRNGGAWSGVGLISSAAAAGTSIGYAEATDLFAAFPASFGAQSVDATSILVRYTASGDVNLDRKVDVADLGILAANWQQSQRTFSDGDLDYSGTVDVNDLSILASRWQQQLSGPSAPAPSAPARRPTSGRAIDQLISD
jgi:hypothetical protein